MKTVTKVFFIVMFSCLSWKPAVNAGEVDWSRIFWPLFPAYYNGVINVTITNCVPGTVAYKIKYGPLPADTWVGSVVVEEGKKEVSFTISGENFLLLSKPTTMDISAWQNTYVQGLYGQFVYRRNGQGTAELSVVNRTANVTIKLVEDPNRGFIPGLW